MIARLMLLAVFIPSAVVAARVLWRQHHRIPAAPDNKPGNDAVDLWICRRIAAQSFYDPADLARLLDAIDQHKKETP